MFWNLLLAHFLADYPLQTHWMAVNKKRAPVLMLHAGIHFVVMMLVCLPAWKALWLYLFILSAVHFGLDYSKISLGKRRPAWVGLPYLFDQLLHYLTLGATVWWIGHTIGVPKLYLRPGLAIIVTAYLLATYVWAISERVLTGSQPEYRQELDAGLWPRMAARALLLTGLLWLKNPGVLGGERASLGAALPYLRNKAGFFE